jgi:cytochrome P450
MGALAESERCNKFMDAFAYAQRGTGIRTTLGKLKFLHWDNKWWEACRYVTDYADEHVELALQRLHLGQHEQPLQNGTDSIRLVDEMAKDTQDRVTLRSHIISVFSPAHDGAAQTLTNAMFHLARNSKSWAKLKAEIEPTKHERLTYDLLNSYQYLNWVLKESRHFTISI